MEKNDLDLRSLLRSEKVAKQLDFLRNANEEDFKDDELISPNNYQVRKTYLII